VRFVDTDVLLYAVSKDPAERDRAARAGELLRQRDLALSVQVLQEFYVQATRETRPDPLTHDQAVGLVESFLRFPVQPIDVPLALAALASRHRFGISYWDAAIIEAARPSAAASSCPRTSATAPTTAASRWRTRSAESPRVRHTSPVRCAP
jgi:predicted nucleic acid-binding protein